MAHLGGYAPLPKKTGVSYHRGTRLAQVYPPVTLEASNWDHHDLIFFKLAPH